MAFNSLAYALFFPIVFFGYWFLSNNSRRSDRLWLLLLASYFFYGYRLPAYILLLFAMTAINYLAGLQLENCSRSGRPAAKKSWLAFAAVGSLGILAGFKYYNFFRENLSVLLDALGAQEALPVAAWALPLGISFYTFQSLSYSIDVYRGKIPAVRSLRDFALYVAFFPQLLAGPINRAQVLVPQFQQTRPADLAQIKRGLFQVLAGLFKKIVIADVVAYKLVDPAFGNPGQASLPLAWLTLYGYTLQIYCDFSGYSDVAIGSARLLGIHLPENFNRPYVACNPREFWRRWHISLSTWLRDYLYISLGGARRGQSRLYLALFLTMLLGGLWHGAAWTFVLWGGYHGLLIAVHRYWLERKKARALADQAPVVWKRALAWLVTFHLVGLGWLLFRSASLGQAAAMVSRMIVGTWTFQDVAGMGVIVLGIGYFLHFTPVRWREGLGDLFIRLPVYVQGAGLALMLVLLIVMQDRSRPFIYFNF